MIWTIIILIKVLFGALIFSGYNQVKKSNYDLHNIELVSPSIRKKALIIYLIGSLVLTLAYIIPTKIKSHLDNRPYEVNLIGEWECFSDIESITFFDDSLFIINDTFDGIWSIVDDSTLKLMYTGKSKGNIFEINKLTSDYISLESLEYRNWCIRCDKKTG